MPRSLFLVAIAFALTGCGTLTLQPDVPVSGNYPLSWSDVREIERLLPGLRIDRPISRIYMGGPNRASVDCDLRTPPGSDVPEESVGFTVVRRRGRWIPVDKPSVGRLTITG